MGRRTLNDRRWAGRNFRYQGRTASHAQAKIYGKQLRKQGHMFRIVKNGKWYEIWKGP